MEQTVTDETKLEQLETLLTTLQNGDVEGSCVAKVYDQATTPGRGNHRDSTIARLNFRGGELVVTDITNSYGGGWNVTDDYLSLSSPRRENLRKGKFINEIVSKVERKVEILRYQIEEE